MASGKKLTSKQEAVLSRVNSGKSAKQIADDLGIKANGVHAHIRRLREAGHLPAASSGSAKAKPAAKRGSRRRATTRTARVSRNGSSPSSASAKALQDAVNLAHDRVRQIDGEIEKLNVEKSELLGVRVSPA